MSNELLDNIDYNMIIDDNEDNIQIEFAAKINKTKFCRNNQKNEILTLFSII